ncbi:MAG: YHS domain-containing (seleno)protein [Thalassobaculum sp.]|jgi:YHS domain-containing protein
MRYLPAAFRLAAIAGLAGFAVMAVCSGAGTPARGAAPAGLTEVYERDGLALGGYDAVAYFLDREPVAGSAAHRVEWRGTVWQFSSAENALLFRDQPERYAPQYGGYSLYGMSVGKAYATDPRVFDIIDGKLYLSRNEAVREIWQRNPDGYIAAADAAWRQAAWSEVTDQFVR